MESRQPMPINDRLNQQYPPEAASRRSNNAMSAFHSILLRKSFWGGERKFLEPLMRFMRGNVRDHIVSSKIDHEPPQWR
jgi:hypothetical protein